MTYKPYSVVVVPFPFVDSIQAKNRPAAVLSSEDFQVKTNHIVLLMITSAKHQVWYGDHEIINLKSAGLTRESIVRQKIFTLDMRLIKKSVGHLSAKDRTAVTRIIRQHLLF